jgi:NADPH2 dehydrogenase
MRHFTYKTLAELQHAASALSTGHVGFEEDKQKIREALARPVQLASRVVGNSMAIHPMEGCDGTLDGRPDELTIRRYERFARGGAKLIWFEATAVREDGRANTRQLWITRENVGDYAAINKRILALHKEAWGTTDDVLMPVQLTHSGRYAVPRKTIAYHNPLIDAKSKTPDDYPVISDDELERLEDAYVDAAGLCLEAGFSAIDMKAVHGYLIHEMLGAKTFEGSRYRGPELANRTRFIKNVLGKLKAKFGSRLTLCMRLNAFDSVPWQLNGDPYPFETPYPFGWGVNPLNPLEEDLTEVKTLVGWVREWGVEVLNISIGCPYYNPHIGRPFEKPDDGNYEQPEHPLLGVDRHFRISAELQRAFPDFPLVGTGYSWLQKYAINAAAHNVSSGAITFFGLGRGVLAYPDFGKDVLEKGELDELRVCKTLTYCTYLMRQKNHPLGQFPAGCPPFDKEAYGGLMKDARAAQRLVSLKQ